MGNFFDSPLGMFLLFIFWLVGCCFVIKWDNEERKKQTIGTKVRACKGSRQRDKLGDKIGVVIDSTGYGKDYVYVDFGEHPHRRDFYNTSKLELVKQD